MPHQFTKKQLIDAINDSLDLPVLSEETEGHLIEKALGEMIDYVPPILWPILADATKGVNIELLRRVVTALSQVIIDMLPLPWLPASVKANLVTQFSNLLIERAQHGMALPQLSKILQGT